MEPENSSETIVQEVEEKSSLHKATPFSKYLAMTLFVILPFVGGWIGYQYAPEKVVEVEKVTEVERIVEVEIEKNKKATQNNQEFYLEPMVCSNFVGEFCSMTLEIDGVERNCILGTSENGMTIPYNSEIELLQHCETNLTNNVDPQSSNQSCAAGEIQGTVYGPADEAESICYEPLASAGKNCVAKSDCRSGTAFSEQGACKVEEETIKVNCNQLNNLYVCDNLVTGVCSEEFFGDYSGYSILQGEENGKQVVGNDYWGS